MAYAIQYAPSAERAIRKFSRDVQSRILKKMEEIAREPRGMGSVKLTGHDVYRVRVGDYRILYSVLDDRMIVLVVEVGNRRDVYRDW